MVMKCERKSVEEAEQLKGWIVEQKLDGTRTIFKEGRLISPERQTFKNDRFGQILGDLKGVNAILDGEIYLPNGTIHSVNSKENWAKCRFAVFDVLEFDGRDLTSLPLFERQKFIPKVVNGKLYVEEVKRFNSVKDGWKEIIKQDLEGLVVKNPDGRYEDKRSRNWIKVKNYHEAVIEITGYEAGSDKGAFILSNGGRMSALSKDKVEEYHELKKKGRVFAELEYLTMTSSGKFFQPILKRLRN